MMTFSIRRVEDRTAWLGSILRAVSVCLVVALLVLPLLIAALGSIEGDHAHYTLSGWEALSHDRRALGALGNSIGLALVTQSISMVIGIGVAWLIGRTDLPARDIFEFSFWISFFLPALAVVQGWTLLLDPHYGLLNRWLINVFGLVRPPFDVYSWGGIVFAHLATTTVSAKVMMLTPALRAMDARLEEAALMNGSTRLQTLRKVTLPILKPAIVVAALLGLVYALQSFEIELVLGSPRNIEVYSTVIYNMTRSDPIDFRGAFVLGNVIAVVTFGFAWFANRSSTGSQHATISSQATANLLRLGHWRWPLAILVGILACLLTVVPLVFLIASSMMTRFGFFSISPIWTSQHWQSVLSDSGFLDALRNTLIFASGSAALAVSMSLLLAHLISRSRRWESAVLSVSSWAPSSIPGVLFSLAWLWLILRFAPDWVYGSTLSLILVTAFAWITLGTQLIRNQLSQLSPHLVEAAWLAGSTNWTALRTIVLPLCLRSIVVVAIMVFVSAIRDVGHIALLSSGSNQPLSILQLGFLVEGRSEAAAVIGVMLAALAIAAAWIARHLGLRQPTQ